MTETQAFYKRVERILRLRFSCIHQLVAEELDTTGSLQAL